MKKNLVPRKHEDLYKKQFLPFIETEFTLKSWRSQDLVLNNSLLGYYFNVDRRIIADFLKQAENDGLIKTICKVRKFDDKITDFAVNKYDFILADEDSPYYSKMQEYINDYMLWTPDFGERVDMHQCYLKKVEIKSIKQLDKEERARAYFEKYSWTEKLMKEINETRPERLKSKYLVDGKLREHNFLCSTLNPEKEHQAKIDVANINYRYTVLKDFFGTSDFIECDTNGSIYRLSYNLNHEKLLAHNVDIYSEFWRLAGFKGQLDKISRDNLKLICMVIFMSNGDKNGYNSTLIYKDDMKLTKSEYIRKIALKDFCSITGLEAREFLDVLTAAMYRFLDTEEFLEEEIFIHESNLHLLILDYCKEHDIPAVNVYDGFYFIKGTMTQSQYQKLYDQMTLQLKALK